ncbi:hypothetical protein BDV28DRAFT_159993 [Aspergillus coremiiformis]|uniref:Enoyl reductase (ER) domain-containing protein n=1 Tax=Aspergillus coremiiformis TaxID=138285 RepID=A0A5N6YYJ3_9EURO|nr:hypothetical protein BDV28DRAFT_159993 [Aspergillus coremiiformis]
MDPDSENKVLVIKNMDSGYLVVGEQVTLETVSYDATEEIAENEVMVQLLYATYDLFKRDLASSSAGTTELRGPKPVETMSIAKVLKSNNSRFQVADLVIGRLPVQQYVVITAEAATRLTLLENPCEIADIRLFLSVLGIPGLLAFSSLYEIGRPKKGETIMIAGASDEIGQLVGQMARLEGLKVYGSVESDEKLDFLIRELGFDGGFNYAKESPYDALPRLVPEGIDIYYDNLSWMSRLNIGGLDTHFDLLGSRHLNAAFASMRRYGRVVFYGTIAEQTVLDPIIGMFLHNTVLKRLTIRGFGLSDPSFGKKWGKVHMERMQQWVKEEKLKIPAFLTVGIDNAAKAFVETFYSSDNAHTILAVT